MRDRAFILHTFLFVVLLVSSSPAADSNLADSVQGVPRGRLIEFWEAYSVTSLHYGKHGVPGRMKGYFGQLDTTDSPINAALGFIEANFDIFRVSDPQAELIPGRVVTDSNGARTVILQQVYRGIPVFGGRVEFEITPWGSMEVIRGRNIPGVQVSVDPTIDSVTAIASAADSLGYDWTPLLRLAELSVLPQDETFLLVWRIDWPGHDEPVFVDAHSGGFVERR